MVVIIIPLMNLEQKESLQNTVYVTRHFLGCQSAQKIFKFFNRQLGDRFVQEAYKQLPELSKSSEQFLSKFKKNLIILCEEANHGCFNDPLQLRLYTETTTNHDPQDLPKEEMRAMILISNRGEDQYLYLGLIKDCQPLFIQQQLDVTIVAQTKKQAPCDKLSIVAFFDCIRLKVDDADQNISNDLRLSTYISEGLQNLTLDQQDQNPNLQKTLNKTLKNKKNVNRFKKLYKSRPAISLTHNNAEFYQKKYIDEAGQSMKVPFQISKYIDQIPKQYFQGLIQRCLQRSNQIFPMFTNYLSKFNKSQIQCNQPMNGLFKEFNTQNIFENLKSYGRYSNRSQPEEFFPNDSNSEPQKCSGNQIESYQFIDHFIDKTSSNQSQKQIFSMKIQEEDDQIMRMIQKIKSILISKGLKCRSINDMASKFVKGKRSGKITQSTMPNDLMGMDMNIGVAYRDVLYQFFMSELKQQKSNLNENQLFSLLNKNITQIVDACEQSKSHQIFSSCYKTIMKPISVSNFCNFVNNEKIESICKWVNIPVSPNLMINCIIKMKKSDGFIFIFIEDTQHNFDCQLTFLKNQKITPGQLSKYVTSNKDPLIQSKNGVFRFRRTNLNSIYLILKEQLIEGNKDYFTGFIQTRTLEFKDVVLMIKVSKQRGFCSQFKTFKVKVILMSKEGKFDKVFPYVIRNKQMECLNVD